MPNGTCSFGRQHKCSVCSKQNCKKIKHPKQFTPSSAHITSFQPIVGQSGTENFADEQILNELKQLTRRQLLFSNRMDAITGAGGGGGGGCSLPVFAKFLQNSLLCLRF